MASTTELENLLDTYFKFLRIEDLTPEVLVVSTNLFTGTTHIAQREEMVVDALLDSTAIPLYFRVWKDSKGAFVDGGICENLAADKLRKEEDKYGPIVGISFKRTRSQRLRSLTDYLKALLNTAIDNSVERARQQLGADSVFDINAEIDTFDFERAFDEDHGLGDTYKLTKRDAADFFASYISGKQAKGHAPIAGNIWQGQNPDTLSKLGDVYDRQHKPIKYNLKRATFIVQANCLLKPGASQAGSPDLVRYEMVFHTLKNPLYCQKLALQMAPDSRSRGRAVVTIEGPLGEIRPTILPVRTSDYRKYPGVLEFLVFFDPVLREETGDYKLTLQELVDDVMPGLKDGKNDDLHIIKQDRAEGKVERMELVILLPKDFRTPEFCAKRGAVNEGERMLEKDLSAYNTYGPQFRPFGWAIRNADPTEECWVDLVPQRAGSPK